MLLPLNVNQGRILLLELLPAPCVQLDLTALASPPLTSRNARWALTLRLGLWNVLIVRLVSSALALLQRHVNQAHTLKPTQLRALIARLAPTVPHPANCPLLATKVSSHWPKRWLAWTALQVSDARTQTKTSCTHVNPDGTQLLLKRTVQNARLDTIVLSHTSPAKNRVTRVLTLQQDKIRATPAEAVTSVTMTEPERSNARPAHILLLVMTTVPRALIIEFAPVQEWRIRLNVRQLVTMSTTRRCACPAKVGTIARDRIKEFCVRCITIRGRLRLRVRSVSRVTCARVQDAWTVTVRMSLQMEMHRQRQRCALLAVTATQLIR